MLICGAASPMPWAAYMLSNISADQRPQLVVEHRHLCSPGLGQHRVGILHHLMNLQAVSFVAIFVPVGLRGTLLSQRFATQYARICSQYPL